MTPRIPSRRTFFKGMSLGAAGTVLTPMLDRALLGAEGQLPPTRFLFVVEGNSLPSKQIHPKGLEYVAREGRKTSVSHSLAKLDLPPALEPVKEFKDRMAIVQGLSGRMCSGGHSSDHGALGAFHATHGRNVLGPTVDGVLGKNNPGIFANVVLGISSNAHETVAFNCSADAPRRSLPTIMQPMIAYERLFGSVGAGAAKASFAAKRNLLDHMTAEVNIARKQLGSLEREKLDGYLNAFESMRDTSARLVEVRDRLEKNAPIAGDKFKSEVETDRLDAQFELATASLVSGLTNVATIASGVGFPHFAITFTGLGINTNKHSIGHALYNDDLGGWIMSEKIRAFHFSLIARTMKKLQSIPEGNGTMLDNTVIVYLSDGAETHHSRCFEWPMVVLGNARGKLKTDGRYILLPDYGKSGHRTINTMFNTLLHASGASTDNFGRLDPHLDRSMHQGALSELLA